VLHMTNLTKMLDLGCHLRSNTRRIASSAHFVVAPLSDRPPIDPRV
jgi:hypothetical protein